MGSGNWWRIRIKDGALRSQAGKNNPTHYAGVCLPGPMHLGVRTLPPPAQEPSLLCLEEAGPDADLPFASLVRCQLVQSDFRKASLTFLLHS